MLRFQSKPVDDGAVNLCMLLAGEHEFKLLCPAGKTFLIY